MEMKKHYFSHYTVAQKTSPTFLIITWKPITRYG